MFECGVKTLSQLKCLCELILVTFCYTVTNVNVIVN